MKASNSWSLDREAAGLSPVHSLDCPCLPSEFSIGSSARRTSERGPATDAAGPLQPGGRAVESASDLDPYVLRLLVELTTREGRRDEADIYARRLLGLYQSGQLSTSQEIAQAAYAAWQLALWQDANQLFMEAAAIKPVAVSLFVDWGNLYLKKYNAAEAELIFRGRLGQPLPEEVQCR